MPATLLYLLLLLFVIEILSALYLFLLMRVPLFSRFIFLGVAVHELLHALACFLVHAPIHKIKISQQGGMVVHEHSRLPYVWWLGDLLITWAPLLGGIFLIWLTLGCWSDLTWWEYLNLFGVHFSLWPKALKNLADSFSFWSWKTGVVFFLLFNLAATLMPSKQDYKNVAGGLGVILLGGAGLYYFGGEPLKMLLDKINLSFLAVLIFAGIVYLVLIFILGSVLILKKLTTVTMNN